MKVYLNRPIKREAWGGGSHFITSFAEYLINHNIEVVFDLNHADIDFIFMFDPRPDSYGKNSVNEIYQYKVKHRKVKVIHRINDTDIARPKDKPWRIKMLLHSNQIADHTIFISDWLKNHYIDQGYDPERKNTVILNGCNYSHFYPSKSKVKIHDERKINLVTHHWSDNYMKGFEVYNFLDKNLDFEKYEFTYIGRYNKEYQPKNIKLVAPLYGKDIGDILRQQDIYITGAQYEACGMHHIEGAACGLPILYRKGGGGIKEISKNHGLEFDNLEEIIPAINKVVKDYSLYYQNIDHSKLSSERCFKEYLNVILT